MSGNERTSGVIFDDDNHQPVRSSELIPALGCEELMPDPFGTLHGGLPGHPTKGQAIYGDRHKPAYGCGCQPLIHRFKCVACERVVGWCFGGASESRFESAACNACVVAVWESADRIGRPREHVIREIDNDPHLRRELFAQLKILAGVLPTEVCHGS